MSQFKPNLFLNVVGDMLEITWSANDYYAKQINRYLTIKYEVSPPNYKGDEEIVGIEITNFSAFIKSGVRVDPEYDEFPPLNEREQAEVDDILVDLLGAKPTQS